MLLLVVLPLVLIAVLGLVADEGVQPSGVPLMDHISITMILAFQLFGGAYALEYLRDDLFAARRWRMYSLPYPPHIHAYAIVLSSTLFTSLLAVVLVLFTHWVYGVNWGHVGYAILTFVPISLISQLVGVVSFFATTNPKLAERITEIFGFGSLALAEIWFPLPDIGVLTFLSTYGNPISLGGNIIYTLMSGQDLNRALVSAALLVVAAIALGIAAIFLGRRRLA